MPSNNSKYTEEMRERTVQHILSSGKSATSSTSWVYNGRTVRDMSYLTSQIVKTQYIYGVMEYYNWYEIHSFDDVATNPYEEWTYPFLYPLVNEYSVDMDLVANFQQTITERQSFVIRVPKTNSSLYVLLSAKYAQIYFDNNVFWDTSTTTWSIHQATRTVTLSAC